MPPAVLAIAAVASAAGAVASSVISSNAAKNAAKTQASAADRATQLQKDIYDANVERQQPYVETGNQANALLKSGTNAFDSPLLKPVAMDQATLEATPGYKFNLSQGLKATQNAAAARGMGVSGAALKGAANYATGLADSTYQNQFNNAVTNQTNQFNRLFNLSTLGENAAAGVGSQGVTTGANIGSNVIGGANAQAASQIAGANAVTGSINSGTSNAITLGLLASRGGGSGGFFGAPVDSNVSGNDGANNIAGIAN